MPKSQIVNLQEHSANEKFKGYVQRVAFSIVLSQPMIRALQVVRDYPAYNPNEIYSKASQEMLSIRSPSGQDLWMKEIWALERRGLAYHNPAPQNNTWPKGHVFYKLTYAGELMCELLIEAGLMPELE